jgi:hypothetical protein
MRHAVSPLVQSIINSETARPNRQFADSRLRSLPHGIEPWGVCRATHDGCSEDRPSCADCLRRLGLAVTGTPAALVAADEVYGADPRLRADLERREVG